MECRYQQLSEARTVAEIVDVTRAYLATWSTDELDRLPAACRPANVADAGDIESWSDRLAVEVTRAVLLSEDESRLHRMVSHFLIASVRMRQLQPS